MSSRTVPLSWATRLSAGAVERGISLERLFDRALIAPRFGDDRDEISTLQLVLLYATLILETGDGTHALLRRRHPPETGPLGLRILLGSPDLADGLDALAKFYQLSSTAVRWSVSTEGAEAFVAVRIEDDGPGGLLEEDIQLCYLYFGLTCFLGRPLPVSWVTTRDAAHVNIGARHYLLGGPVRRGAASGFAFRKSFLAMSPATAGFEEFGWRPLRQAFNLLETLDNGVSADVNNRDLRVANLAADLNISPATYRRMMVRDGEGFRQVRERALLDAALDRLRTQSSSLDAIAADLGYSDARSLRRFIKRATGRTPNELRQDFALAVPPSRLHARLRTVIGQIPL